jgi:hypothetical protein
VRGEGARRVKLPLVVEEEVQLAPAREGGSECTVETRVGATVGRGGGQDGFSRASCARSNRTSSRAVCSWNASRPCARAYGVRDAACPISTG